MQLLKKSAPFYKRIVALVMSVMFFTLTVFGVGAQTLAELQAQQSELQSQKDSVEAKLEQLKNDVAQKQEYMDEVYVQIDVVQQQLDVTRQEIDALNLQILELEESIADKQASIDENFELLKERIKALYKQGEASTIAIILNSRNLMDFTEKSEIMRAITAHDKDLIDRLTEQLLEIEDTLDKIKESKETLAAKKKDLDDKSEELSGYYDEAYAVLVELKGEQAIAEGHAHKIGVEMGYNEAEIAELEEQIRKQLEAERKAGNSSNVGGSGYTGTGNFIWPMPGYTYITCYYGSGGHRGIDVAGGGIYGKAIVASDGGVVTYAGWNDSYGYCVFIDHGNGYETRYAHMSQLGTTTGSSVGQNEVIGYVGSTGNSTGPHLHFEVIRGGSTTNPMSYF